MYLWGKNYSSSDYKHLQYIMMKVLANTPSHLQKMLLRLQKYDIKLIYKVGKHMIPANTLSRVYTQEIVEEILEEGKDCSCT